MSSNNLLTINGAKIFHVNLSGEVRNKYDKLGQRYFLLLVDRDLAEQLSADHWNIKQLKSDDPKGIPQDYVKVFLNYSNPKKHPRVWAVSGESKTLLSENTVGKTIDSAEIENVDLIIDGSHWINDEGIEKVTPYVKTMFVRVVEDELEKRYRVNHDDYAEDEDEEQPWQ